MKVNLLTNTGLWVSVRAAKTCYGKPDMVYEMSDLAQFEFLKRIIKAGHESVLEHSVYVLDITGISRACLQELARHRHISLSVKSTRWALGTHEDVYVPKNMPKELIDFYRRYMHQSFGIVNSVKESNGNDVAKYFLPEGVVTDLILTVNLRELRHMWKVRHSEKALLEFQIIMEAIVESLPEYARELVTYSPEVVSSDSSLLSKATDLLRKASHSMEGVSSQNESGSLSVNTPLIEGINEFLNTVNNLKEKGAEVNA